MEPQRWTNLHEGLTWPLFHAQLETTVRECLDWKSWIACPSPPRSLSARLGCDTPEFALRQKDMGQDRTSRKKWSGLKRKWKT